jgi:hypothetical protein
MLVLIPSLQNAAGPTRTALDDCARTVRAALDRADVTRVVLVLGKGEPDPGLDDPRLVTLSQDGPAETPEPFPAGLEAALALAGSRGLLEGETVLVLHRGQAPAARAELDAALERFVSLGAAALVSVEPSRDHPCQLQAPVTIPGRCLVLAREAAGDLGPLASLFPGDACVSRPFAFDWSPVLPGGAPPLVFTQVRDEWRVFYRRVSGLPAPPRGAALWIREDDRRARIVEDGDRMAALLPQRPDRNATALAGWSPAPLAQGVRAVVTGGDGTWTLRARLSRPTKGPSRLLVLPISAEKASRCGLLETAIAPGQTTVELALPAAPRHVLLVSLVQDATGPECDLLLPYAPDPELWRHHPQTGTCTRTDTGRSILGRQDFPEVLEPNGAFLLLGPTIRSLQAAFASPRLGYHTLHPEREEPPVSGPMSTPGPSPADPAATIFPRSAPGCGGGSRITSYPQARLALARLLERCEARPGLVSAWLRGWSLHLARIGECDRIVDTLVKSCPQDDPVLVRLFSRGLADTSQRARVVRGLALQAIRALPPDRHYAEILEIAELSLRLLPKDKDMVDHVAKIRPPDNLGPLQRTFRKRQTLIPRDKISDASVHTPFGLALRPDTGTLAVANEQRGTVSLFGPSGRFLREVKHPGRLSVGLAFDEDGCLWVATAVPDGANLFHSDPDLNDWTGLACQELLPDFPIPWTVCAHAGRVYVQLSARTPYRQSRVVSFEKGDPGGSLRVCQAPLGMPGGITASNGHLLVAERIPPAVWRLEPDCSSPSRLADFGPWDQIFGLQSDGDTLYVATVGNLVRADTSGRVVGFTDAATLGLRRPTGIALAGDALFLTDYARHVVGRYAVTP